jgi:two-component system, sensor histidine kinase and response regulator
MDGAGVRLRVLVVDDELGMREGAARVLRRMRYAAPEAEAEIAFEVDTAADLAAARTRLEAGPCDLLLLDYKLPDGTGLDLLGWIQERSLPLLTVMITAFASLEVAVSTTRNGAWDFLAKPFSPEELGSVVQKAAQRILLERRARELAQERKRVRFQFISVLAHELKSPLAVVESYLDLLKGGSLGPEVVAYRKPIERSLERLGGMRKLIFDLLDLTRIESGEKRRELTGCDLRRAAEDALEAIGPQAAARSIALELEAPGSLPLTGDSGELEIIFNNLISNAVKYNRDGGRVSVRLAELNAEHLEIAVADTGIGMAPEDLARLFGEFVRIKTAQTRDIPGSGLGLSILKRLSALYGGEVGVTSEPGVGTTFRVTLRKDGGSGS